MELIPENVFNKHEFVNAGLTQVVEMEVKMARQQRIKNRAAEKTTPTGET